MGASLGNGGGRSGRAPRPGGDQHHAARGRDARPADHLDARGADAPEGDPARASRSRDRDRTSRPAERSSRSTATAGSASTISRSTPTCSSHADEGAGERAAPETVFLRADKLIPYGEVLLVMDRIRKAGVTRVALVTVPSKRPPSVAEGRVRIVLRFRAPRCVPGGYVGASLAAHAVFAAALVVVPMLRPRPALIPLDAKVVELAGPLPSPSRGGSSAVAAPVPPKPAPKSVEKPAVKPPAPEKLVLAKPSKKKEPDKKVAEPVEPGNGRPLAFPGGPRARARGRRHRRHRPRGGRRSWRRLVQRRRHERASELLGSPGTSTPPTRSTRSSSPSRSAATATCSTSPWTSPAASPRSTARRFAP